MPFIKRLLSLTALAVGLGAWTGPAAAVDLKLAHQFAPDSIPGQSATRFAESVAAKSGGNIKVTVIPGGALGDQRANIQQLQAGSIDLALTGDSLLNFLAKPYMIVSMPFLYKNVDHHLAVLHGEIGREIDAYLLDKQKIRVLAWQYVGTRVVTSNKPIHTLDDFKGLKLRLPHAEVWLKTWAKLGTNPVSVAFTELYLGLQMGVAEAQENPPNFIIAQKYYEVQKYLVDTEHLPQMNIFFASEAIFSKLTAKEGEVLEAAANETAAWTNATAKQSQASDIEWLVKEGGMEIIKPDMSGIDDLVKTVPQEVGGDLGTKIYARIQATAR